MIESINEYKENLEKLATINNKIIQELGKEHYLSTFSTNMLGIMKQYLQFIDLLGDNEEFIEMINETIKKEIEFLDFDPEVFKEKNIFKKRKKLKALYAYNLENITSIQEDVDKVNDFLDREINSKLNN